MKVESSRRGPRTRGRRDAIALGAASALALAFILLAAVFAAPASSRERAKPVAAESSAAAREFAQAPGVREWSYTIERGPSPFDRVGLHRVTRAAPPPAHPMYVMLYLPGTNMNGDVAVGDPRYSLALYMAMHGVDFWALDYRTHFIAPATPMKDLAELKGWNSDRFESDIAAAASYVMKVTGRRRIVVAGFSRGASFAYLYAARHPQAVQGLVILDGWIPAEHRAAKLPPDRYVEDIGGKHLTYDKRQALMKTVIANPDGPAPLPKYKSARANLEAVVYGARGGFGGHGGLANPAGGYSDPVVLARMLAGYDRYWPAIQDYENPFTAADRARLAASKIPVIAFSSSNIGEQWKSRVAESAHATGSKDVTVKTLAGWGHLDVICGTHAEADVFAPALEFIKRRRK
jgi:pimeloyl-ACP methyl ester carboxylesterase